MKSITRIGLLAVLIGFGFSALLYSQVRGRLVIQGSTTVFPVSVATAEAFMRANPGASISVRGGGSGGGIRAVVEGGRVIGQSSRPMRHNEKMHMRAAGRRPVQHIIALDGMAIILHPSNPVGNLTMRQVRDIYAGRITDWAAVGGNPGRIVVVSRDVGSGTFGSFVDIVMDGEGILPGAVFQASSGAVVSAVAGSPGAIGYAGKGFVDQRVKAITVDGIAPERQAVIEGKYPISRPLFFYTDGEPTGLAKAFIDFVLSEAGQRIVVEQGFFSVR